MALTERQLRGRRGEDAAVEALELLGFVVEDRNVRVGRLEIDVLASDEAGFAAVEVRAREAGASVGPFESMVGEKEKNLENALALLGCSGESRAVYVGVTLLDGRPVGVTVLDTW